MKNTRLAIGLGFVGILTFISCSKIQLEPTPPEKINSMSKGEFCTLEPETGIAYTNYLLIIDYSGSNSSEGTDPNKKRIEKAYEFYNSMKDEPFTRWGIITFDSDAEAIINEGDKKEATFTEDPAIVEKAFKTLRGKGHSGLTNYADAIDMADGAITKNNAKDPTQRNIYGIFFITDGKPTAGSPQDTNGLVNRVAQLVAPGDIYFSGAFYGRRDAASEDRIRRMAEEAGHGKFANFDRGDDVDFSKLIVGGETREAWILKKDTFFVYNLNSAICENGRYEADSDADGLCDADERAYHLDPQNRSTPQLDENGVLAETGYSDYFYYITVLKGKRDLPKCKVEDRIDQDMDLLNNCEESLLDNLSPVGSEWPKGQVWTRGNPLDPDTDNDGIIDGLEAIVFRNHLGWATDNRANQLWDGDRENAFRQIQMHKNPLEVDPVADIYDTEINLSQDVGDGRACYDFRQNHLKLFSTLSVTGPSGFSHAANENIVLVYFIQTKFKDPNGKGIYMYSFQNLLANRAAHASQGTSIGLKVNNGMFTPYEVYKVLGKFE